MKHKSGFTLIEALTAVVILSTAIVLAGQGLCVGLRMVNCAKNKRLATHLAANLISQVEAKIVPLENRKGDFGNTYPDFTWELNVQPPEKQCLYQLSLTVSWLEKNEPKSLEVARKIFRLPPPEQR